MKSFLDKLLHSMRWRSPTLDEKLARISKEAAAMNPKELEEFKYRLARHFWPGSHIHKNPQKKEATNGRS